MRLSSRLASRASLLLLLSSAACAPSAGRPSVTPAVSAGPALDRVGRETRVLDARTGTEVTLERMLDALAGAEVVFVGEQHDDPATHRLELAVLEGLARRGHDVTLSLEMFERDVQPQVDAYVEGRAPESAMLASSRPWPNYATDYRPLVELARERGWPVVAANVPRPLASMVARAGLAAIDTLAPATRAHVAAEISCPDGAYRRKFLATMSGSGMHGSGHGAAPATAADSAAAAAAAAAMLERVYHAQCVKDETMAESIVRTLQPGRVTVHVNGAFHSDDRLGTVERVLRRRPDARVVVVSSVPVPSPADADLGALRDRGDYVVVVRREAPAPR